MWNCVVTLPNNSQINANGVVAINLNEGDSAICVIVNNDDPPQLTLKKTVINDNGGNNGASEWTLTADDGQNKPIDGPGIPNNNDSMALITSSVTSNVQYTLSESNGPAGYSATNNGQFSCVTTDANNQAGQPSH